MKKSAATTAILIIGILLNGCSSNKNVSQHNFTSENQTPSNADHSEAITGTKQQPQSSSQQSDNSTNQQTHLDGQTQTNNVTTTTNGITIFKGPDAIENLSKVVTFKLWIPNIQQIILTDGEWDQKYQVVSLNYNSPQPYPEQILESPTHTFEDISFASKMLSIQGRNWYYFPRPVPNDHVLAKFITNMNGINYEIIVYDTNYDNAEKVIKNLFP